MRQDTSDNTDTAPGVEPRRASYGSILKSSSIIGGAEGVNYGVSLLRTKVVAILLGPSGIGLLGLYSNVRQMLVTLAGLGVSFSAVREIAKDSEAQDPHKIASTIISLRRICWLTGILGWVISAALCVPISRWVFDDQTHAYSVALLGAVIFLSIISSGQKALVQGLRRIGDLARIQGLSVVFSSIVAIGIYAWLREDGIVPALIAGAVMNLCVTWYFSRKIEVDYYPQAWSETVFNAKALLGLGAAFMWSILLMAFVDLVIRTLILRELNIEAVGMYEAAWAISGLFASFVLSAMGADFYPRLTQVEADHPEIVRLVNEQTEIGLLLAVPGLLGTLVFAPWVIQLLYTAAFSPAALLLPWLVLGVTGRVVSWPLGFILLAKGAKTHYAAVETVVKIPRVLLVLVLLKQFGLVGVAIALPINYLLYWAVVFIMTRRMVGFHYNSNCVRLLLIAGSFVFLTFLSVQCLPSVWGTGVGALITAIASYYCINVLARRLGETHRLTRILIKMPFLLNKSSLF